MQCCDTLRSNQRTSHSNVSGGIRKLLSKHGMQFDERYVWD